MPGQQSPDKPPRSHHKNTTNTNKQVSNSSRSRRNVEEQRASLRAKFGSEATQLRLTVFIILVVAFVLTSIAFFSTNWLEVERRYYGSKFKKLGLWRMCFNSYSAPDDYQFRKFYVGCRWIFADEYKAIRKFLLPGRLTIPSFIVQYKHTDQFINNLSLPPT